MDNTPPEKKYELEEFLGNTKNGHYETTNKGKSTYNKISGKPVGKNCEIFGQYNTKSQNAQPKSKSLDFLLLGFWNRVMLLQV